MDINKRLGLLLGAASWILIAFLFSQRTLSVSPLTKSDAVKESAPIAHPARVAVKSTNAFSSTSTLRQFVDKESLLFGVNPELSDCIVENESQWLPQQTGDDGNSRGLWQISRIWHSEVSDKTAYDPYTATIWSLKWITTVNPITGNRDYIKQWSTRKKNCSQIQVFISDRSL